MYKPALLAASIIGATAVIIGAFGAHALKEIFTPEQMLSFETGVKYQFYHTLALAFTGLVSLNFNNKFIKWATLLFTIGIVFFSGSIYLLNFLKAKDIVGVKGLGLVTPLGGVCLVAAWICVFLAIRKKG